MNTPIHDPDKVRELCEKSAKQAEAIADLTEKLRTAESERDQARHALQRQQAITAAIQNGQPLVGTFDGQRILVRWDYGQRRWERVSLHGSALGTFYAADLLTELAPRGYPERAAMGVDPAAPGVDRTVTLQVADVSTLDALERGGGV